MENGELRGALGEVGDKARANVHPDEGEVFRRGLHTFPLSPFADAGVSGLLGDALRT